MDKNILNRILQVTVIMVVAGIFLLTLFSINIFALTGLTKIPTLISGIVFIWALYFTWGWKLLYLRKLVFRENLNGTWYGTYRSKGISTNTKFEGEIALVIRQSFLSVNVTSYTERYINNSFGEALNHQPDNDSHQLVYLYSQFEFKPSDDNSRKGATELTLYVDLKKRKLFGNFWTNHDSVGNLNLVRISKKHCKSFKAAQKLQKKKK